MDTSTSAAVAALVVACFALLIASAQVLQQYFITGQLIRLCDSVVFGPLPGQGRRIWQLSQLRFRVVYSIPQISLDANLWPEQPPHTKSYAIGEHSLPPLHKPIEIKDDSSSISDDESLYILTSRKQQRKPFWNPFKKPSSVSPGPPPSYQQVGEATWVSFCRAIEVSCGGSVFYDFVEYDADRCPPDLVTAPMQVSMRDIAVMGLMAGMQIMSCSFREKSIAMQGHVGTLTSSAHPVLGPLLHFTPRQNETLIIRAFGVRKPMHRGMVESRWLARTWDVCIVAGRYFASTKRRTTRRLDERWLREQAGIKTHGEPFVPSSTSFPPRPKKRSGRRSDERRKYHGEVAIHDDLKKHKPLGRAELGRQGKVDVNGSDNHNAMIKINHDGTPPRYPQDGAWVIIMPQELGKSPKSQAQEERKQTSDPQGPNKSEEEFNSQKQEELASEQVLWGPENSMHDQDDEVIVIEEADAQEPGRSIFRRATVEHIPEEEDIDFPVYPTQPPILEERAPSVRSNRPSTIEGRAPPSLSHPSVIVEERRPLVASDAEERSRVAKERQAARNVKLQKIEEDKSLVAESVKQGSMDSPYTSGKRRKPKSGLAAFLLSDKPYNKDPNDDDEKAPKLTKEEEEARAREEERHKVRRKREAERTERNKARDKAVNLIFVDAYWICQMEIFQGFWATPWQNRITGFSSQPMCVGAVTVILEALLGFFDDKSLIYTSHSRLLDTTLWMFNGSSTYPAYAHNARGGVIAEGVFQGVRIPAFKATIPAVELLYSYEWQVHRDLHDPIRFCEEQNVELMRLDSWLSYVGRTEEISAGKNRLLKQTPALVDLVMEEFDMDFHNIDLSASEGGLQDIQSLAANVMDFFADEELSEAEQLYMLVALLRTMKVCQCILAGPNTEHLQEILLKDVQVHLV